MSAPSLSNRAPVAEQRERPQWRGKYGRAEIRAGHGEGCNADHEQHGQHRVPDPDDRLPKGKDGPVGPDDADLRERVKAKYTREAESQFTEPKSQRRSEIAAEYKFVADGEQQRHLAGRRAVEQRRNECPKRSLRECDGPEHHSRAPAQEFNEQGNVMHWPRRGEDRCNRAGIEKPG